MNTAVTGSYFVSTTPRPIETSWKPSWSIWNHFRTINNLKSTCNKLKSLANEILLQVGHLRIRSYSNENNWVPSLFSRLSSQDTLCEWIVEIRLVVKRRLILGPGRQINLHCRLMAVAIPWAHWTMGPMGPTPPAARWPAAGGRRN